ncbi:MAG: hypothetical protein ACFKPT_02365 [Gloeotrichia echinulata GP01]
MSISPLSSFPLEYQEIAAKTTPSLPKILKIHTDISQEFQDKRNSDFTDAIALIRAVKISIVVHFWEDARQRLPSLIIFSPQKNF